MNRTHMKTKSFLPYLLSLFVFMGIALAYFSPVLKGEKILQSDIQQFRGMAKEIQDYRARYDEEAYWTDAAFGGMPSYQLSTYYPHDYIKKIDSLIRFLPRPADYLFLYFVGFFVLLLGLKLDWRLAGIGALAFGFSTYFIIILGVGHNAKAHAIGYIPFVLFGFLWVFQRKYFKGFLATTLAMALEINASHPQMTYYLLLALLLMGLFFLWDELKTKKPLLPFFKSVGITCLAFGLALGMNAHSLLATKEYADQSTRGKSDLTLTAAGTKKEHSGLSKAYITEYSYGFLETFNLLIPRFTGGANSENLGTDSHTYAFLSSKIDRKQARQFSESVPTYWGSQPIVAAPAYIGAIFIFLFVLGIFSVPGKLKRALVAITGFSILMSWGENFSLLTNFFIDYVPLYNKFRAVSSIQILAEITIPLLGMLALHSFVYGKLSPKTKEVVLKKSFYIVGGTCLFFVLFGSSLFGFDGANDVYYNQLLNGLGDAIVADRKTLFFEDSLRSFLLVFATTLALWLFSKERLQRSPLLIAIAALLLFDMVGTARRYVNNADFYPASKIEMPFVKSAIDKEILKDTGHYRVANFTGNFMSDGATSYFHKSIGGYHAAKLGRYQELVDFHIVKNNWEVLNMLNTKYFMVPNEQGQKSLQVNSETNGNAWFVDALDFVDTADQEILSLSGINTKKTAIVNQNEFPQLRGLSNSIEQDTLASIELLVYKANELQYTSSSSADQFAVFSEIYYKEGWNAYIDGELQPHYRANYVLRALPVPKGEHMVEFKFEPTVIANGSRVVLFSILLFFAIAFYGGVQTYKNNKIARSL